MSPLTVAPRGVTSTFMGFDYVTDFDRLGADVVFIGLPHGKPYSIEQVSSYPSNTPTALRRASKRISLGVECWDFDIGGTLFDDKPVKAVDVGDVPADPSDPNSHWYRAEIATRNILATEALLIVVGGDTSVSIPV